MPSRITPALPSLAFINPPGLYDPRPNGYSHVAVADTPARLIFAAGQGGENVQGELQPDFLKQVRQALDNVQTALQGAGATLFDVAKLTVLVVDHSQERLAVFSQEIKSRWGIHLAPACTLIPVPRLALDGMLVEIEATALLPL
ncbi:hypothetical protein LMG3458_05179 [Achromobacter deleyi]|uniref:Aminoacrylate peracid reductase RutC n=1 Tax=Achromobacter deleyi TaxID=1353891 RepID=A0A6S7AJT6_9BURK|nr:RidA family protein [Achromobacter deleyi]CAB3734788.1 hypothetical protein LMG3458_05179 [Achromobacter deleyi]CAB3816845.1 hypothetical protein LMG3482_00051 [Achromobacter deleyi]CAB3870860.1 hypothetical protein LMG3481_02750 [Achromobacter deleyi]